MVLRVHRPVFPLHRFVDNFIYYEGLNPVHSRERFLPDGNAEFIVELTDTVKSVYDNETLAELRSFRHAWVSGVRTRPITIPSGRNSRMLIVAFKRGGAHPFFKFPMSELADQVIDATLVFGDKMRDLRERLIEAPSVDHLFQLLESFLMAAAGDALHGNTPSLCVEHVVSAIVNQPTIPDFLHISRQIGYSQKHFIDLFKRQVGVPPKQYLRIMRFQKAIHEIGRSDSIRWSDVAIQIGRAHV